MVDFGSKLKELRLQAGMTQKELASKLGVTSSVVSYYELSERTPSPEVLVKLSYIFHVSSDYLLGITPLSDTPLDITGLNDEDIAYLQRTIDLLKHKNTSNKV